MVINDTKQFTAIALDVNSSEVDVNFKWELETGGGSIDRSGLFTAEESGKWKIIAKYQALNGEFTGTTTVRVLKSADDTVTETFDDPESGVGVTAGVGGSGTIEITELDDSDVDIPEDLEDLGIFIDIIKSETLELGWALIKIPFDSFDLPANVTLDMIRIYYWSGSEWILVEDSWVDGGFVYANVTHFTIFAPMAESAQKESAPEEEEDNLMVYALAMIIIIVIIVIVIGILIRRKRPSEKELAEVEGEEEEELEAEELEIDLDELEPEQIECKKCGEPIDVPTSDEDKVSLKCGECGAKGRIPNPYLDQIEELKKQKREELELEEMDDWDSVEDEDELEWADDDEEELEDELEDWDRPKEESEDDLEDWDRSEEDIEEDELKAVEEFEEEEELPDWDAEIKQSEDELDELDDWD
jgi:hypothetical protein